MNGLVFSILLVIIGLIIGFGITFLINFLRGKIATKKAENVIKQAKKELAKISSALDKSGTIVIPLEIFINKKGLIKIKIWVGQLMRKIEKKQVLKDKDNKLQMDREIKNLRI